MDKNSRKDPGNAATPAKFFDEKAFDEMASIPNGWSKVADPVAEIRRMRGDFPPPGNAAALRKALEDINEELHGEMPFGARANARMSFIACNALAKPPRNCDKFATFEVAVAYWNKNNQPLRAEFRPNLIDGKQYASMSEWLMDTAEGGAE